jgi:hypothetical protein
VPHLRITKNRVSCRNAQVAMQSERHAHADAIAVERGNHRFVERNTLAGDGAHQRLGRRQAAGAIDLLDVGAGAKRFAAGAGDHRNMDGAVISNLLPDRAEPLFCRYIQRIEHVRAIERDDGDAVASLFQKDARLRARHGSPRFCGVR